MVGLFPSEVCVVMMSGWGGPRRRASLWLEEVECQQGRALGLDQVRGWGWMLCEAWCWGGGSGGEPGSRPPDGSLMLGGLQQASVMGHDLVLGQVQVELQRHEDGELEGYQLSAVHSEPLLQFLRGDRMEGFYGTYEICLLMFTRARCVLHHGGFGQEEMPLWII